jgi:hypothetical protein
VSATVSREALEDLVRKYAQMLAMRLVRESEAEARPRMAELASRFPGALRELDSLELSEILRRSAELDAVLHQGREVERWMEAVALFHALARGALSAKRWLAGRKLVDEQVEREYARAVAALAFPADAGAWVRDLACIASPPRGRMSDLVFARIARHLGTSERDARVLVFGLPRRERRLAGRDRGRSA